MKRAPEKTSDLIGRTYNYLKIVGIDHYNPRGFAYVNCKCLACGKNVVMLANNVKRGTSKSCGCMRGKFISKARLEDLSGKKFGYLTVIKQDPDSIGSHDSVWICKCDCGNYTKVRAPALKAGTIKSCGCMHQALERESHTKYKTETEKRLANVLSGMMTRCYNVNSKDYQRYGGRGIYICDEWLNDKLAFVKWGIDAGYAPGLQIERIDNDGPYAPWNCRWATNLEQSQNRRDLRPLTVGDTTMLIYEWIRLFDQFRRWYSKRYTNITGSGPTRCTDDEAITELSVILDDFARSIGTSTLETPVSELITRYKQFKYLNKEN